MVTDSARNLPFSQRTGIRPIPPQLKSGEVSSEFRRLMSYYISLEIDRESMSGYGGSYFEGKWKRVAQDIHVKFLKLQIADYKNDAYLFERLLQTVVSKSTFDQLFDFLEFLLQSPGCSKQLKSDISEVFVEAQAVYRVFDGNYIGAIGVEEQAVAFENALNSAEQQNATAARRQLIEAAIAIRNSKWSDSVRNSIHAVEAMAVRLAPNTNTLGAALKVLERQNHLNGSLKSAFDKLYGYSCTEEGVRHALVFDDESKVDEADALFMLGACASFVSYLLARSPSETGV